jgi:uncharacterized protein YggE
MKILTFLSLGFFFSFHSFAADLRTVSVRGEGELKVAPDVAIVSIQVQARAKDAKAAQSKNAAEASRVMSALKKEVDGKDIQTVGLNVNPEYNYGNNGKQAFRGYQAVQTLSVRMKKLDRVGALLDQITSGNPSGDLSAIVQSISFDSDKRREIETEVLGVAMKNAEARANALASFAKRSLKAVMRISDSSVQMEPYRPVMARLQMADAAQGGATEVATGQISITANVAVEYEMN